MTLPSANGHSDSCPTCYQGWSAAIHADDREPASHCFGDREGRIVVEAREKKNVALRHESKQLSGRLPAEKVHPVRNAVTTGESLEPRAISAGARDE
jgi:hypothetical protein